MTNEEKYKTTDERLRAFWRFCKGQEKKNGCLGCPTKCVPTYREQCALTWLAYEAEDEKPKDCPFCGGRAEVVSVVGVAPCVECQDCGAIIYADSKEWATEKWNRRMP